MTDIIFEGNEAIFVIKEIGSTSLESFNGKFRVTTMLSPLDHINTDKLSRQLLGEYALTADHLSQQYAFMLSQLHFRVLEGPLWWKSNTTVSGGHIKDTNVLSSILDKALEAEEIYRNNQKAEFERLQTKLTKDFETLNKAEMEEGDED